MSTSKAAARVKAWRKKQGLGLRKAASDLGISVPSLHQAELGRQAPGLKVRRVLHEAIGIPIAAWEAQ